MTVASPPAADPGAGVSILSWQTDLAKVPAATWVLVAAVDSAGNKAHALAIYGTAVGERLLGLSEMSRLPGGVQHWKVYAWALLPELPQVPS